MNDATDVRALLVSQLSTGYKKRAVVQGASLQVSGSEIVGLVGLNGVGKTTLLKALLGLHSIWSGEVAFFGRDNSAANSRRKVFYVPEKLIPLPTLSGYEWVNLNLGLHGIRVSRSDIEDWSGRLALDPACLRRRISTYSKGMLQKLALISAFLSEVDLLILDEPMSGLDPLARLRVKENLKNYRAGGRSVLLSSHVLADVSELCDRMIALHDGQVRFDGVPADLLVQTGFKELEPAFLELIGRNHLERT